MGVKKTDIENRITEEIKRLGTLFRGLSPKTKKAVHSLIENAAFMAITLEDLQVTINRDGVTEVYTNGANQSGIKKSSAVEVYNQMVKNHMSIMKQLTDLLPKEQPRLEDDGLDKFIDNR